MSLSYNEFVSKLSKVTGATSVTGQKYYDIHIIDNLICGKRGNGTSFQINMVSLYNNSSLKFETMAKRLYAAQPKSSLTV